MRDKIHIATREHYDEVRKLKGIEPLIDPDFDIEIHLRKQIQDDLWGSDQTNILHRRNFFLWIWEHKMHICEETGTFLGAQMSAEFMSHILTRGAHVEMWNDPRNINILTPDSHRKWETGKREKMKIWDKNKETIAQLKSDYAKYKTYQTFPTDQPELKTKWTDEAIHKWYDENIGDEGNPYNRGWFYGATWMRDELLKNK
jgi:hypothetical protein